MKHKNDNTSPMVDVVVEIPKGSFVKRGWEGKVDFISPFPCPFNYGSIPEYIGCEGDLLDAVVLGPRLPRGKTVSVIAHGAVGLTDRGLYDDKLICSQQPLKIGQRNFVVNFFHIYAFCKGLLNFGRGRSGRNYCNGWGSATLAIARAQPRIETDYRGPLIPF